MDTLCFNGIYSHPVKSSQKEGSNTGFPHGTLLDSSWSSDDFHLTDYEGNTLRAHLIQSRDRGSGKGWNCCAIELVATASIGRNKWDVIDASGYPGQ